MEYCPEARELLANREFQGSLARLRQGPLVPYTQVFRLKFRVLELLFQAFGDRHGPPEAPGSRRGEEFSALSCGRLLARQLRKYGRQESRKRPGARESGGRWSKRSDRGWCRTD